MVCPICPRRFNGSQGRPGSDSSASILRYNGTGAFSACQYKTVKTLEKPGNQTTVSVLDEPQVSKRRSNPCPYVAGTDFQYLIQEVTMDLGITSEKENGNMHLSNRDFARWS